jgi:hypothetical protein
VVVLVFEGLDTFATVRLNDQVILESDNMFVPYRIDVTERLKPDSPNELEIVFGSARLRAIEIKDSHPEHKWVGFNGDMARLAVRKAQYHWYVDSQTTVADISGLTFTAEGMGLGSNTYNLRAMATHSTRTVHWKNIRPKN